MQVAIKLANPNGNPNWRKGVSGNPNGRPSVRKALEGRLKGKLPDGVRKVDAIADALIEAALEGDIRAITVIADRLDGKPVQRQEITGAEGGPVLLVRGPEDVP